MEGAVGGGGGDGLARGAAHASDLDVLRDNPGAAASRAGQCRSPATSSTAHAPGP